MAKNDNHEYIRWWRYHGQLSVVFLYGVNHNHHSHKLMPLRNCTLLISFLCSRRSGCQQVVHGHVEQVRHFFKHPLRDVALCLPIEDRLSRHSQQLAEFFKRQPHSGSFCRDVRVSQFFQTNHLLLCVTRFAYCMNHDILNLRIRQAKKYPICETAFVYVSQIE